MADERSHEETKERILSAAEELFAVQGFDSTSVRDITTAAESNIAAVNYHFGGKEKLYIETAHRLLADLRDQRISRLKRELEEMADARLEDFLRSFARTFLEAPEENTRARLFLLFFAREMLDPHLPPELFFGEFIAPLMEFTTPILMKLAPPLGRKEAVLCMMSIVGQLHQRLKARKFIPRSTDAFPGFDNESYLEHIVRFSAAGVRACATGGAAS